MILNIYVASILLNLLMFVLYFFRVINYIHKNKIELKKEKNKSLYERFIRPSIALLIYAIIPIVNLIIGFAYCNCAIIMSYDEFNDFVEKHILS